LSTRCSKAVFHRRKEGGEDGAANVWELTGFWMCRVKKLAGAVVRAGVVTLVQEALGRVRVMEGREIERLGRGIRG
jgi:hypothetical protein